MNLWHGWHRVMVLAAGVSVLAACYAVSAWGQQGTSKALAGTTISGTQTVTVSNLRIPAGAWHHYEKAKSAAEHHQDGEFERESAKALEIAPGFAQMYLLRAAVQTNAHAYEAAVASALAAAKADPGAMWNTTVLAGAYNGMHRFGYARLVLDAKHGPEAETWQAMYERARAEIGLRDIPAALHWSGMALRAAPLTFADANLVRANALILANQLNEAAAQLEVYLQSKDPRPRRAEVTALHDAVRSQLDAAANPGPLSLTGPQAGPQTGPQIALQSRLQTGAQIVPQAGPHVLPQPGSQIALR